MSKLEVTIELPFYLRVEVPVTVLYEQMCQGGHVPGLIGQVLEITFSQKDAGRINKMSQPGMQYIRTSISIGVAPPADLSRESVNTFAIKDCLEIINRVITSYQATTTEVGNAGFIFPLGTSYMQLSAEISVDGVAFRDRYPGHNINTFPLPDDKVKEFEHYLIHQEDLPLSRLFLVNAKLALEQGQYPLVIVQAATAVELPVTQYVVAELKRAGCSAKKIRDYEKKTLGTKLGFLQPDPRSLETYLCGVSGFTTKFEDVKKHLNRVRNKVVHRGYLASYEDARRAVGVAQEFLGILNSSNC